jgi:hypothetical protein
MDTPWLGPLMAGASRRTLTRAAAGPGRQGNWAYAPPGGLLRRCPQSGLGREDLVDYDELRHIRCAKAAATPYETSALAATSREIKRQSCEKCGLGISARSSCWFLRSTDVAKGRGDAPVEKEGGLYRGATATGADIDREARPPLCWGIANRIGPLGVARA